MAENVVKVVKNIKNLKDLGGYDLKILCLGRSSKIYQNIVDKRSLDKDYKEIAITGYAKHSLKNLNTAQYFLKDGPLAILPFLKNNFSFVWSVNKEFSKKNINNVIKSKICELLKTKKIKISNQQSYPLQLNLKRTYGLTRLMTSQGSADDGNHNEMEMDVAY